MRWADDVPEEVKQERLHRLLDLYEKKAAQENGIDRISNGSPCRGGQ